MIRPSLYSYYSIIEIWIHYMYIAITQNAEKFFIFFSHFVPNTTFLFLVYCL